VRVVIPSRKRVSSCAHVLKMFPGALVVVDESELEDYSVLDAEIMTHPPEIAGIGPLRNWILDYVPDETVFMVDDDLGGMRAIVGRTTRSAVIRDPRAIGQIITNAEYCARKTGTPVFGFNQNNGDVRKFRGQDPITFSTWIGSAIGVIGRELRYDDNLLLRADIDYCLQAMLHHRVVFVDQRFAFYGARFDNVGGNAHMRSKERNAYEMDYLKRKWGKWILFIQGKATVRIFVRVKRRQLLSRLR